MEAVPRRLLALGGGPVGVEMAGRAPTRRRGRADQGRLARALREPAPLGGALGEVLRRDGIRAGWLADTRALVQQRGSAARRRADSRLSRLAVAVRFRHLVALLFLLPDDAPPAPVTLVSLTVLPGWWDWLVTKFGASKK